MKTTIKLLAAAILIASTMQVKADPAFYSVERVIIYNPDPAIFTIDTNTDPVRSVIGSLSINGNRVTMDLRACINGSCGANLRLFDNALISLVTPDVAHVGDAEVNIIATHPKLIFGIAFANGTTEIYFFDQLN